MNASTEIVNVDQAAAWDGHEGDVWTDQADRYDRASARFRHRLLDATPLTPDLRAIDLGCGTGAVTRAVAQAAHDGSALGVDLSSRMLDLARRRSAAEGLDNVAFVRGDAQVFSFEPGHDVAISSFGAMFFNDPVAAFANIATALRPEGRLGLLAWRRLADNPWLVAIRGALAVGRDLPTPPPSAPSPFALADPDRVSAILHEAGFTDVEFLAVDESMDLGSDTADAMAFSRSMGIVEGLLEDLDANQRALAMADLEAVYAEHETPEGVLLQGAAWLITATKG